MVGLSLVRLVMGLFFVGRGEFALRVIDRMQTQADRGGADEAFLALLGSLRTFRAECVAHDVGLLLREAEAATARARALDDPRGLAMVLVYRSASYNQVGDFDAGIAAALEGVSAGGRTNNFIKEGW